MKKIIPLVIGFVIAASVLMFATKVTNDLRTVFGFGAATIAVCGLLLGAFGNTAWYAWLGLSVPPVALFLFEMYASRNKPFTLIETCLYASLWIATSFLAVHSMRKDHMRNVARIAGVIFLGILVWYANALLPTQLARSRNRIQSAPAPKFALQTLDGAPLPLDAMKDKIVVLDFFSTSCVPCIKEMPEMEQARKELNARDDIRFYLVVSDLGGDTPDSIRAYAKEKSIEMPIAYDRSGIAHDAFGFVGVPALVVLDKSGNIRLTRQGYNSGEKSFRSDLVSFVSNL